MNRMTVKRDDGRWAIANNDGSTVARQFEKLPVAIDRLAAYEDTGLEPEEIQTLISPPNAPLTLEELRRMDWEWVWIADLDMTPPSIARHAQLVYHTERGFRTRNLYLSAEAYGKTWLAYRRKPEEGV